jgi:hypothetical protein
MSAEKLEELIGSVELLLTQLPEQSAPAPAPARRRRS